MDRFQTNLKNEKMKLLPRSTDFIDVHSHHKEVQEGVFRIHNIFSSEYDSASRNPVSVGLHPWHLSGDAVSRLQLVLELALRRDNVLAAGETGLDKLIKTTFEEQMHVFRIHVEESIRCRKPLIIHCVKAFPELLNMRREYPLATPWIIHGFNSNQTIAAECVKMGIYISFSRRLLRNPEKAAKVRNQIPITFVFAETDEDEMGIDEVYAGIADLYNLDLSELKHHIFANFNRVFNS